MFEAFTVNTYDVALLSPVMVKGDSSFTPGVHSVQVVVVEAL